MMAVDLRTMTEEQLIAYVNEREGWERELRAERRAANDERRRRAEERQRDRRYAGLTAEERAALAALHQRVELVSESGA